MARFLSERKSQIKVGISSYTDSSTVLEVTGRVGIGTTRAESELNVVGDAIVTGIVTASEIVVEKITSDNIEVTGVVTATQYFGDGSQLTGLLSNKIYETNVNQPRYIGFVSTTSGILTSFNSDRDFVFIPSTGNVGLGTSAPTSKLEVVGDVLVSGVLTASEIVVADVLVTNNITVEGFISGITTAIEITVVDLAVQNNASVGGALTALSVTVDDTLSALNIEVDDLQVNDDLNVDGDAYISGILTTSQIIASDLNLTGIATANYITSIDSLITGVSSIGSSITMYADTGIITATKYYGDGADLTGLLSNQIQVSEDDTAKYIGFLTATSGIITAFATNPSLVFLPSQGFLGIGSTAPRARIDVDGNIIASGIVTAGILTATDEIHGDLVIGTPTGGFQRGAVAIATDWFTKDAVDDINFILGKLVPKPPTTIVGAAFTVTTSLFGKLCTGFTPINNTDGELSPSPTAGTQYNRNTSNLVSSQYITQYGPGDAGTVVAFINSIGVGTATLSTGVNDGTYGSLQIANDKDAFFSTRNTGIASEFYEVYDARIINATSPDGFNKAFIRHTVTGVANTTQKYYWYEDPSTVTAPVLTFSTPEPPVSPVLSYSSGVPHFTESASNAFSYVLTCENATGDMYLHNTDNFCTTGGQTSGFQTPGNKTYINFQGGTNPPSRNFGVGTGVTTLVTQSPVNTHIQVSAASDKFSTFTATTPYGGSGAQRPTITQLVNIMGTTATTSKIDEDNILISSLGTGSGNSIRTQAGSGADNPSPTFVTWDPTISIASYESAVVGGVLTHNQVNYSTGYYPVGPNYSSGRSGSQYIQFQILRSAVSGFKIVVTGTYAGCWVCMPNNSTWTTSLSGVNGWANMFAAYRGSGVPTTAQPGCALGGNMTGSSGTFTCTFGTESSSNDSNNRILVRFKLNSGNSITALSFTS